MARAEVLLRVQSMQCPVADADLAWRIAEGDADAERDLVLRFGGGILGLLRRRLDPALAEDVCQETLRAAIESLRRGRLKRRELLGAYLRGIAWRMMRREWRRRWRETDWARAPPEVPDASPSPEDQLIDEERRQSVRAAVAGLSERDRAVLIGLYLFEADKRSMCERLALRPDQFDVIRHRAVRRLGRLLRSNGPITCRSG